MHAAIGKANRMPHRRETTTVIALIVAAFVVRAAVHPFVGDTHQYVPAYAATVAATWLLGWRAGAIAALVSLLACEVFPPISERDRFIWHNVMAHMAYLGMSMAVVSGTEWVRYARREARELAERLRDQDRHRSEFMALLGHELRNPLATISISQEVLQRGGAESQAAQPLLAAMQRQTRHMTKLVDDLLDVARLQTGKLSLERSMVDVFTVVQEAVVDVRASTDMRQQKVVVQPHGELGAIYADSHRLRQMLINLIHNASKFSPAGAVIEVDVRGKSSWVSICVTDHGSGIEPSQLQRIFEPFVQFDRHPAPARGLGLGLPLTRELAQMHGGNVCAFSAGPGRGSQFLLSLPRERPAGASAPPDKKGRDASLAIDAPASADGKRVLVVDDDPDAAATLAVLLRLKGHRVTTAGDGRAALQTAARERPDLAFIDIGLPDMTGLDVAMHLRSQVGAQAVLVALTGWSSAEDEQRSRAAGFDAHLVKPIDMKVLDAVLASDRGGVGTMNRAAD